MPKLNSTTRKLLMYIVCFYPYVYVLLDVFISRVLHM